MYKFLRNLSCLLCLILVFGGCRKKAFDAFYGKPSDLAPPIYQVLQSRGNFTNLLACIDKAGYKPILSAAGYWTFFAPNDAAFQKAGLSADKITDSVARQIVQYALVFNAYATDHLADFQSTTGYIPASAFKRRTSYYSPLFKTFTSNGKDTIYVEENRVPGAAVVPADHNNKYIPYFYSSFMDAQGLTATDYNYFWPNSTYTGFNVVNAAVVNKDIVAQNGIIHEIDQVIMPLPSIAEKLEGDSNYSLFTTILKRFLVTYQPNATYKLEYTSLTGQSPEKVFVKSYASTLTFAPGNESWLKLGDNDAQQDGYTMFAPTNVPLRNYLANTILEFYAPNTDPNSTSQVLNNMTTLPQSIIADLVNAHFFQNTVWPTKFATTRNLANEPARFDANADVTDKQFCSNGIFYGVSKVQATNVFSTVYARAYLDPRYSIMTMLLNTYYKAAITSPGLKYTVFMMPDDALAALGYGYNPANQQFTQTTNGQTSSGDIPKNNLKRILDLNIVPATIDGQTLTPTMLQGNGVAVTNNGEYIRWHNNQISSGANFEKNYTISLKVDAASTPRTYSNGIVYYLKNDATGVNASLDFPLNGVEAGILANGKVNGDPYFEFNQYLINSGAYNPATSEVLGVQLGAHYTVFIPTKAALSQAVKDGVLPGTVNATTGVVTFNYKPTTPQDQALVTKFMQYHILAETVVPDGQKGGALGKGYPTLLKDETGKAKEIIVFNSGDGSDFKLEDGMARYAHLTTTNYNSFFPATSNYLGNNVVYQQIDNYLQSN